MDSKLVLNLRLLQYKSFGNGAFAIFNVLSPNRMGEDTQFEASTKELKITNAVGVGLIAFFFLLNLIMSASLFSR